MPNIFQAVTGGGYRDAAKTMTIKALEERQKEAALAAQKAAQVPEQIANPWQGMSHLAGVLSGGMEQNRADAAASSAREQLARLKAGFGPEGPSQEQVAQYSILDPEGAKFYEEQAYKARDREDQQKADVDLQTGRQTFDAGQNELTRNATATQNDLNRQGDIARQKLTDANADNRQDDAQLATENLARLEAQIAEAKKTSDLAADNEQITKQQNIRMQEAERLGYKRDSPEWQEYVVEGKNADPKTAGMSFTTTTDADGTTTTSYSTSDKTEPKNIANALEDYRAAAQSSNDVLQTVDIMRKAGLKAGYTGPGGEWVGMADDALEATIGKDYSLPGTSGARALVKRGALTFLQDAISKTKGSISEAENKLFLQTAPTLDQTPEGREFMLAYAEKLAQRAVERSNAAEKYRADKGNLEGFENDWNRYIASEPIIDTDPDTGELYFVEYE